MKAKWGRAREGKQVFGAFGWRVTRAMRGEALYEREEDHEVECGAVR
jgi:hypothetical protein